MERDGEGEGAMADSPVLLRDRQPEIIDNCDSSLATTTCSAIDPLRPTDFGPPLLFAGLAVCVAGHTLLVHQHGRSRAISRTSRGSTDKLSDDETYSTVNLVLASELLKLIAGVAVVCRNHGRNAGQVLESALLRSPSDMLRTAVPAAVYAAQNNLVHVALRNLDAATFQVTSQLKILWTAFFMWLLLDKRFSARQKGALLLLCVGETLVHSGGGSMPRHQLPPSVSRWNHEPDYLLGLTAALVTCFGSGFAGVVCERLVKRRHLDMWIMFVQISACGVLTNGVVAVVSARWRHHAATHLFHEFEAVTWMIVVMSSSVGILTALVVQRLDSVWKSMASSASVVLATMGGTLMSSDGRPPLGGATLLGTAFVVAVPWLYHDANMPAPDKVK